MIHANDILFDDRTLIQIACDEMRRRTDKLHTAVISLVVGLSTLETGQETVVDIDNFSRHSVAQRRRQNLHVPSQDDQFNIILLDEFENPGFLLLLRVRRHGEMHEGHLVRCREGLEVRVVRYDEWHLDRQLAGGLPEEQVIEAVADLGDHDQDTRLVGGGEELEGHRVRGGDRGEGFAEGLKGGSRSIITGTSCIGAEVHAHEEAVRGGIAKLRGVDDVQVVLDEETGHGADDAGPVGAGESENKAHVEEGCFESN